MGFRRLTIVILLSSAFAAVAARADSSMSMLVEHELASQDKLAKKGAYPRTVKEKYRLLFEHSKQREYLFLYLRVLDKTDGKRRYELSDQLLKEKDFPYAFWIAALIMQDEERAYDSYKYWRKACSGGLDYTCDKSQELAEATCNNAKNAADCAKIGSLEYQQKHIQAARLFLEKACTNKSAQGCHARGMIEFEYGDLVETKQWMDKACEIDGKLGCDMAKKIHDSYLEQESPRLPASRHEKFSLPDPSAP